MTPIDEQILALRERMENAHAAGGASQALLLSQQLDALLAIAMRQQLAVTTDPAAPSPTQRYAVTG